MLNLPNIESYQQAIDLLNGNQAIGGEDRKVLLALVSNMMMEVVAFRGLANPETLHVNLLRGIPAQLSQRQLLHLAGAGECSNQGCCITKAKKS